MNSDVISALQRVDDHRSRVLHSLRAMTSNDTAHTYSSDFLACLEYAAMCYVFSLHCIEAAAAKATKAIEGSEETHARLSTAEQRALFSSLQRIFGNRAAWKQYHQTLRSAIFALRHSPHVRDLYTRKALSLGWLLSSTPQQRHPALWQPYERAIEDDPRYIAPERDQAPMTTALVCRKCHSRTIIYRQVQTRSADEPMTLFVQCLECKNRWKM